MANTTIANVIQPEPMAKYIQERSLLKTKLLYSGALVSNPFLSNLAMQGGYLIDVPYWNALAGSDEVLTDDGTELTGAAVTAEKMLARKLERGKMFSISDLAVERSGDDPAKFVGEHISDYWAGRNMAIYRAIAKGVIADNVANDSSSRVIALETAGTPAAANKLGKAGLNTVVASGGAFANEYSIIWCHSRALKQMRTDEMVSLVRATDPVLNFDVEMYQFAGKFNIVVDDDLPSTGNVFTSYLLKPGCFPFIPGLVHTPFEIERKGAAGLTNIISRQGIYAACMGTTWVETTVAGKSPTNAELYDADNWDRTMDDGNCGIIKVTHNV